MLLALFPYEMRSFIYFCPFFIEKKLFFRRRLFKKSNAREAQVECPLFFFFLFVFLIISQFVKIAKKKAHCPQTRPFYTEIRRKRRISPRNALILARNRPSSQRSPRRSRPRASTCMRRSSALRRPGARATRRRTWASVRGESGTIRKSVVFCIGRAKIWGGSALF
jgi:hypothetical protein